MDTNPVDFDDVKRRMERTVASLASDLGGLRTGRASASLLDPIHVDAYGNRTPLNQVATISVPEPRMINVQVWDGGMAAAVEKAIRESELGLNPVVEGSLFRIPIPELNEERRREMVKVAHKYAERSKVAIRHIRRDVMDQLKKAEKAGDIGQDVSRTFSDDAQKLTDEIIKSIDENLSNKEAEIMQV